MSFRAFIASGRTRRAREAEVAALVQRAHDPLDAYDGHHGDDRSRDARKAAVASRHTTEAAE